MNRMQMAVLGVSVVAFGGAYFLFNSAPPPAPKQIVVAPEPKVETDEVLVAAQDIPMGTVVDEKSLNWVAWPKSAVSELMIFKSAGPHVMDDIKGSMTRVPFLRGEPMRRDKLVRGGQGGFMSAILPSGKRAVAIKIDSAGDSTAGGFILPNDRVDVVRVFRDEEATRAKGVEMIGTQTILSNVKILAIGQNIQEENGKKVVVGGNATLELDPQQAELIVQAQRSSGSSLNLILRSLVDSGGKTESVSDLGAPGSGKSNGLTIMRFGAPQQATR